MVALQITDTGVEIDPLARMDVHPAAELFPLMQGVEFAALVADIAEHGQHDPVVLTPSGQLLDGRNRWRACAQAGVTPVTRVERSEPWAYVISTNVHRRHLSDSQRAMIGARIAERHNGQRALGKAASGEAAFRDDPPPPSHAEAAELLNVSRASIQRARDVVKHGTKALQQATDRGEVPTATAARVATSLDTDQQNEFVRAVDNGADPRRLASPVRVRPQPTSSGPDAVGNNRSRFRHQHINTNALRHLRDSLDALDLVLKSTPDGLDPSITSEEAAQWLDGLSKGRRALRGVVNLLNDRKESNS
jgi:ParB-like chromosome segregation protein Spo0J